MAKQQGLIRIKGSLNGLTFYQKAGKDFVRKTSGVSKDKIKNDPTFQRMRENMSEFGGAAKAAKSFRTGWMQPSKRFGDKKLHNRLMQLMQKICKADTGTRGKRAIKLTGNEHLMLGFPFKNNQGFKAFFPGNFNTSANNDRNEVTLTLPDFVPNTDLLVPPNATHFKIELAVLSWSHISFSTASGKYENLAPSLAGLTAGNTTNYLPISNTPIGASTTLQATLPGSPAMTTNASLVAAVGVLFFTKEGNTWYPLISYNAMEIAGIF